MKTEPGASLPAAGASRPDAGASRPPDFKFT
jgi:hypothetical protein